MPLTDKSDNRMIALLRAFSPRPLLSLEDTRKFFVEFQELQKIRLAIETHENALVIGERGSGKTSTFNYLYYYFMDEKSTEPIIPVHFSVLTLNEFNQTNFLRALINHIVNAAVKYQTSSEKFRNVMMKLFLSPEARTKIVRTPLPADLELRYGIQRKDDFESLSDTLVALIEDLHKKDVQLFIMLDDTDKISSEIIWSTFRGMRDLLWELKTSIIISALPEQVSEMTKPPLDQFFPYWIKMTSFGVNLAKKLIEKRLEYANSNITIDDKALQHIVEKTKGNPRSIIGMAKNLFETNEPTNKFTLEQVDNLDLPYSSAMNDMERAVINYLAHNLFASASSKEFEESMAVTRSRLAQILNELKNKGLIDSRKEGRKMKYFITDKGLLKRTSTEKNLIIMHKGASAAASNPHFEPKILEIRKGEAVRWKNHDIAGHTVTSGEPTSNNSGTIFDSSLIKNGETYEFTFRTPGTFNYFCQVHPWGTGKIIVKE